MKCFSDGFLTRILSLLLVCSMVSVSFGSAANAHFIQPDTMDPTIQGVGTNRYAYSGNDPVNNSDPNGHIFGIDDAVVGIALGIAAAISFFSGTKEANAPGANDRISNTSDGQQMLNMTVGAAGGTLVGKTAGAAAQDIFGKKENKKQTATDVLNTEQRAELTDSASKSVDDLLMPGNKPVGSVTNGATENIRTVSPQQFSQLQKELLNGAKQTGTYAGGKGTWFELPSGGRVGVRTSQQSGVTLDIDIQGYPKGFKVHQQ